MTEYKTRSFSNDNEQAIFNTLFWAAACGIIGVIGYPVAISIHFNKSYPGTPVLFIGVLVLCAAFMSGFFTGTLFGIPKRNNDGTSDYALNNSLVEIADWLTKIIVGLGLANLMQIPEALQRVGDYVSKAAGMSDSLVGVYTISIIIYFSVLGLYIGYNNMRLVLSTRYKRVDDQVVSKQTKEAAANAAMDVYTDSFNSNDPNIFEKLISSVVRVKDELKADFKARIPSTDEYTTLIKRAKVRMENGLKAQSSLPIHQQDPNKNQWGGKSQNNDRLLTASIQPMEDQDLFRVTLEVMSSDPANPIPDGDVVLFSLHNTFPDPFKISLAKNGVARLDVISYGAFTVGAFADEGKTDLEYDLATIPGAPESFLKN